MSRRTSRNNVVYAPKKERVDRASSVLRVFDEFSSEASTPNTTILMLESGEEIIILRVLHHLNKYASKCPENIITLYRLNLLRPLLAHLESSHLFIRRFGFMLFSQLFEIEEANEEILGNESAFAISLDTYTQIEDTFLSEFSAIALKNFCNLERWLVALFENRDFVQVLFFKVTKTNDPDVLWHGLEIILKIGKHPDGLTMFNENREFPFEFLLTTVKNEYPVIQNLGLDIFLILTKCDSSYYLSKFRSNEFLLEMISILGLNATKDRLSKGLDRSTDEDQFYPCLKLRNLEFYDLHLKTISILRELMKYPYIAEIFYKEIYLEKYFEFVENTSLFQLQSLSVLSQINQYPEAHEILFDNKFGTYLVDYIKRSPNYDIALGIKNYVGYQPALQLFLDNKTIEYLFDSLRNEKIHWADRKEAGKALNALFQASDEACKQLLPCKGQNVIIEIGYLTEDSVPLDIKMTLIKILNILAKYGNIREEIMDENMAKCLCFMVKTYRDCRILLMEMFKSLMAYISEESLREQIIQSDFCPTIISVLSKSEITLLHKGMCDFIIVAAKYSRICDTFIDNKVLDCLLANEEASIECNSWTPAIESILHNNLPVKFALKGRLEITDQTSECFYASHKFWKNIHKFRYIIHEDCSPKAPIFFCHFNHLPPENEKRLIDGPVCYNRKPYDANLPVYLQSFQDHLEIKRLPSSNIHKLNIANTVKVIHMLADFVCTKISSRRHPSMSVCVPMPSTPVANMSDFGSLDSCSCNDDIDELVREHLDELKYFFQSNFIPIGFVKYGSYFEKSLLFKLLADKINLPCAFEMSRNGWMAWNEVSIPLYDKDEKCGDIDESCEPRQPTHVVDLMDHPGNIYATGCQLALRYQHQVHL